MLKFKNSEPLFVVDNREETRLIFTTTETLAKEGPKEPLWWFGLNKEEDFEGVVCWLGERQELWPEWRRIAETEGQDAIADHVARLWTEEPVEQASSVMLRKHEDNGGFDLEVMLVTHRARIVSHRFADMEHQVAFFGWLMGAGFEANAWKLVELGCLRDRRKLNRLIDMITDSEVKERRAKAKRSKRNGR